MPVKTDLGPVNISQDIMGCSLHQSMFIKYSSQIPPIIIFPCVISNALKSSVVLISQDFLISLAVFGGGGSGC